jgi:hypothetical protein
MRNAFLVVFSIAVLLGPAAAFGTPRETIGIGSEYYGHHWTKARDQVRARHSRRLPHCHFVPMRGDGVMKPVWRCY